MKILPPHEVIVLRRVESAIVRGLTSLGFEEVMLPRMLREDDWLEVVTCLGHISEEIEEQTFRTTSGSGIKHVLCHWQCEPFYLAMRTHKEKLPSRVFDRSGWSFRDEKDTRGLHFKQFQRLEAIWFGPSKEVREIGRQCTETVLTVLKKEGLQAELKLRPEEAKSSTQLEVRDIVYPDKKGEIELAGMHLHGKGFASHFLGSRGEIESGCIGISLSRITTILLRQGQDSKEHDQPKN